MKKKICIICLLCNNNVKAATYYNDEIYYNETWDGNIEVVAAGKYIESATIPSKINGKTVTTVGSFSDCTYLKKVTIPSTVKYINSYAFSGCTALTSVNIPNGVTAIQGATFNKCTALKSITLPSSITEISWDAFKGCKSLTNITIPSKVETIEYGTFEGCTSLNNIIIPSNIKRIEGSAFRECTSLTSITIPESVTQIQGGWSSGIFIGCTSLKTAVVNAKCDTLPDALFMNCTALTNVKLSNTFVEPGDYVFEGCTSLKKVNLPIKLKEIGSEMFKDCTSLTTVNIPDTVETVRNSAFENCTSLTSINLPVRNLYGGWSSGAFLNCKKLKTVYFNKKIQEIDEDVFREVPASTLTIYGYAGTAAKSYANTNGFKYIECTPVSSIKITGSNSVVMTKSITLNATVSPTTAYNKKVKWTCSDEKIATVDYYSGVVTGKKPGQVVIKAQAIDGTGVNATYTVKVKASDLPFVDVMMTDWFYDAVKYNYQKGLIAGMDSTHFEPYKKLSRGMLVTILWRMEGSPKYNTKKFKDVTAEFWYYYAVNWAASKGIVNGYSNGKFGPNDNVTREQLASILMNYARYKGKNISARANTSKFTDFNKTESYFKNAVSWCVAKEIISGKSNGTKIDPKGKATRAEAAAMLKTFCTNVMY